MSSLNERYNVISDEGLIDRKVPSEIEKNLNQKFPLREYQKEAIGRFIYCLTKDQRRARPTHLLFHMATGSGKTLLMAANVLYLYTLGYRNFLFFVNSTNIIKKTQENFLNLASSKYLFNEKLLLDGKEVKIQKVDNLEGASEDAINIVFTTIQGLHSALNAPRENSLTYEEFENTKIVIISDEAHHINAWTRNHLGRDEEEAKTTWEHTVAGIFSRNPANIMLEYTATLDLSNPAIKEKYENKILYEYTLKEFRRDGYSKEVKVLQSNFNTFDRALQAVVLSQYRRKIAEKNHLTMKPVILMKSKTIAESEDFSQKLVQKIRELKASDLEKLKRQAGGTVISQAFSYFERNGITLENLALELREDFSEEKTISVNSKSESENNQLVVNSLEDSDNPIRLVFAVDMLNEGWDVLNLFDIVRLYTTRDFDNNQPGTTTLREAQLIGRGARYCPFVINVNQDRFKRKYDDASDDLKILEELYYHSLNQPKYISELSIALKTTGIIPENPKKVVQVKVKDLLKKTDFWKNGLIFLNEKVKVDRSRIASFSDLDIQKAYKYDMKGGAGQEVVIFETFRPVSQERKTKAFKLKEFNSVLRKAMDKLDFYRFDTIHPLFPKIESMTDFANWLSNIEVEVTSSSEIVDNLSQDQKLEIAMSVLSELEKQIKKEHTEYKGTKLFKSFNISKVAVDKQITIDVENSSSRELGVPMSSTTNSDLRLDISAKNWYVYDENYGTDEEKSFVKFINDSLDALKVKFSDIYLLRNESLFKIYRFSDGAATEPDFVLFVKEEKSGKWLYYQLFIEPKGTHLVQKDAWKQDFLREIASAYRLETLSENATFKLVGLPFYNEETKPAFREEFNRTLEIRG